MAEKDLLPSNRVQNNEAQQWLLGLRAVLFSAHPALLYRVGVYWLGCVERRYGQCLGKAFSNL